jgi:hypothetical protein
MHPTRPVAFGALALLLFTAAGCSRAEDATAPAPVARPAAPDPLAALSLDGGKRWTGDEHTHKYIAAMADAVQAASGDQTPAATQALGRQLQEHVDALVAGCRMQGKDHDALHVYLGALLPAVEAMTARDAAAALAARERAAAIVARFGDYFQ